MVRQSYYFTSPMEWTISNLLFLFIITDPLNVKSNGNVLPPIIWDPYNALFACKDPTIHVKRNDKLNIVCPTSNLQAKSDDTLIYESIQLLYPDRKDDFDNCNATATKETLKCNIDTFKSRQYSISSGTRPGALVFEEGKTYYILSTSFRTIGNMDNLVGGSCNSTEKRKSGQYKLRLKVYVCTSAEYANGTCKRCKTEGCYYKDCTANCSEWIQTGEIKKASSCAILEKRKCRNNLLHHSYEEYRENKTNCVQQNSSIPTGSAVKGSKDSDSEDTYKYLSISLAIVCFVIGIIMGVILYKKYHEKSCVQRQVDNAPIIHPVYTVEKTKGGSQEGTLNNGFSDDNSNWRRSAVV